MSKDLVARIVENVEVFTSSDHRPYAYIPCPSDVRAQQAVPLRSAAFRNWFFGEYLSHVTHVPGPMSSAPSATPIASVGSSIAVSAPCRLTPLPRPSRPPVPISPAQSAAASKPSFRSFDASENGRPTEPHRNQKSCASRFAPHDLRRTVATHMLKKEHGLHISRFDRALVLNHRSTTKATVTDDVYDCNEYLDEKREALDRWAAFISRLVADNVHVFDRWQAAA